jgi:DNA-binding transcriptional MerR regulator
MKIGELAKRSGLPPSRLRFYEASGLIGAVQRKTNGYREYSEQTLQTLQVITCAQQAGFSLEEIRNLLPDPAQHNWPHERLLPSLRRKVGEIEALQQRLAQSKAQLLAIIEAVESSPSGMPCADNADRVLAQVQQPG